ncbi:MOSC domain-containing protein [Corynebacterium sp. 320]|uniref:MOSC domain-containing protein n=1 Tax=Corynebacterium TaxID=1716 RepID=UPI00125CB7D1|nr:MULTISPECIES: MOSC domain-containing protein [Corynebacterium]KAB1503585.1 MOSC domain-containing protein [Corynebacterium sp. 320]KAB1553314.1 MOSC domain-containing protein [Corynebacterium sp. 321]KAB3527721.1 MOSC domain-containing protein [Corynebacterium sp. 250]QNP92942.1 MOSC domain-containing protein [Corynebacterium zhongnanshanii]
MTGATSSTASEASTASTGRAAFAASLPESATADAYLGACGTVRSTNIAQVQPDPGGADRESGIHKVSVDHLEVFAPGPNYGDGSGVVGDFVGDSAHHGGADKAVYAFAREELDFWSGQHSDALPENTERFPDGYFGDNLTTEGVEWTRAVIGQQVRVGEALLEVSVPRQPCRTFGGWLDIRGWMKIFTQHADCGCYFRVVEPGVIRPGDAIEFLPAPDHGVTMQQAFKAKMGDKELAALVVEAQCLPPHHHDQLVKLLR